MGLGVLCPRPLRTALCARWRALRRYVPLLQVQPLTEALHIAPPSPPALPAHLPRHDDATRLRPHRVGVGDGRGPLAHDLSL